MTSLQDCIVMMLREVAGPGKEPINSEAIFEECTPGPINKHYEFLGQAALELAVTMCLRERFHTYNDEILHQMRQLLIRNQSLAKAIGIKYHLNECHIGEMSIETISERLVGIIQDMSGSTAVVAIIMPVLTEYAPNLLSKMPRSLRQSMGLMNSVAEIDIPERPIAVPRRSSSNINSMVTIQFDTLIKRNEGQSTITFESRTTETKVLEWGCKVAFQLSKAAKWYAHSRFAQSKKKAKSYVLNDIVAYYEGNREQHKIDSLAVNEQGPPEAVALLPIDPQVYFYEQPVSPMTPKPNDTVDSCAVHIPDKRGRMDGDDDDEYNRHMMDVLLGDFRDINLEHEGKRHKLSMPNTQPIMTTVDTMTTTVNTVTTTMNTTPAQEAFTQASELLSNAARDPNFSIHNSDPVARTAREVIRRMLDISRIDRMLKDPVQVANPKSSMFSYIHNLEGLALKSEFSESGPAHSRLFQATTTLYAGEHALDGKGMGLKKSDAEQMAILNLMKSIVA
ncbi:hypothetical protein BJV82DRAFT_590566 [Fennellomyces sp. T-0311]|nr:hypothetical protein BJV82DRAFT_590566 [Fennellomyces sp. T-0311]